MKVVINGCFGGFNLSDEAVEECIRRGMSVGKPDDELDVDFHDYIDELESMPRLGKQRYSPSDSNDLSFRSNPVLVSVVSEMDSVADGFCSKLKVVDIPFETDDGWEIDDYDGRERIVECHRSWS